MADPPSPPTPGISAIPATKAAAMPSQRDTFHPIPVSAAHQEGADAGTGPSQHDYTENARQADVDAIAIERAREQREGPPDMMVGSMTSWAGSDDGGFCRIAWRPSTHGQTEVSSRLPSRELRLVQARDVLPLHRTAPASSDHDRPAVSGERSHKSPNKKTARNHRAQGSSLWIRKTKTTGQQEQWARIMIRHCLPTSRVHAEGIRGGGAKRWQAVIVRARIISNSVPNEDQTRMRSSPRQRVRNARRLRLEESLHTSGDSVGQSQTRNEAGLSHHRLENRSTRGARVLDQARVTPGATKTMRLIRECRIDQKGRRVTLPPWRTTPRFRPNRDQPLRFPLFPTEETASLATPTEIMKES